MAGFLSVDLPPAGPAYVAWTHVIKGEGGVPTTWPFDGPLYGAAAARFQPTTYAVLYNAGQIDPNALQSANPSNTWIYVLAGKDVQDAAPQVANTYQRLLNAGFSTWDSGVDAVKRGLLATGKFVGEAAATGLKYLLLGVGAALVVVLAGKRLLK